jgi:hypothetical protein
MAAGRKLSTFFGDDWDDALDSIISVPGAFGNILVGAIRQVRLIDGIAFALVVAGWGWFVFGYLLHGDHRVGLLLLALLPTALWFMAGAAGALVFEISGIGPRVLGYWEAYVLIVVCSVLGVVSLRLALNPKDRRVYRAPAAPTSTSDA